MIEVRDISKKYAVFNAIENISFIAKPGEVLGYLGPNGAGKTTTIRILAGLLKQTKGEVLFEGHDIRTNVYAYKKRLGYVPEQSEMYSHLSAYEYLVMVGRLRGLYEHSLKKKIMDFLEIFDLAKDMNGTISSYSKGMRQKVLISAALLHNPDILLLDEPFSGLDVTTTLIMMDIIQKLARDKKIIVYSSHVLEVTEKVCSKVIILHGGRIVANDSVENLRILMNLPSLAEIFKQLVSHEDTGIIAEKLINSMKK